MDWPKGRWRRRADSERMERRVTVSGEIGGEERRRERKKERERRGREERERVEMREV